MSWNNRQQTLAAEAGCHGVGLHTGEEAELILRPAPPGTGHVFVRDDLPGAPRLTLDHIDAAALPGRTALVDGEASVQTIEHLMSALIGLGVDNVFAHLTGPEVPGMDGSARVFAELIEQVGVTVQDAPGEEWVIAEPVHLQQGGASLIALPGEDGYRITYALHYHGNSLAQGHGSWLVDPRTYATELAPCRTFCLEAEVEQARAMGLGKGAGYENTLVIAGDQVIRNQLRFTDEPVRHKVLDLVGDLGLLGLPLRGHIIGACSGHALNREMVARLRRSARRRARPAPPIPTEAVEDILRLIPHRPPFLMIDQVKLREPNHRLIATKTVRSDDPILQGHFPGNPLMPGVLIAESLLQTAAVLMPRPHNRPYTLAQIERFRLRRPVVPGDVMELEVQILNTRGRWARVSGAARVGGKTVADGTFMCAEVDLEEMSSNMTPEPRAAVARQE